MTKGAGLSLVVSKGRESKKWMGGIAACVVRCAIMFERHCCVKEEVCGLFRAQVLVS